MQGVCRHEAKTALKVTGQVKLWFYWYRTSRVVSQVERRADGIVPRIWTTAVWQTKNKKQQRPTRPSLIIKPVFSSVFASFLKHHRKDKRSSSKWARSSVPALVRVSMAVEPAKNGGVDADAAAAQRAAVSADYAKVVNQTGGCCVTSTTNRSAIGYSDADLAKVGGADLGVGCGTPVRLARLAPGETVLDLGCGAGIDCFLAADDVGAAGAVVGVDMTPDMLARAREGGREKGLVPPRVEFRLGEIENLPAGDNTVDAVISNCVINLSPDKPRVLREALRVLKPGGTAALPKHAAKENVQKKVPHPNPLARVSALDLSWVFFSPFFFSQLGGPSARFVPFVLLPSAPE